MKLLLPYSDSDNLKAPTCVGLVLFFIFVVKQQVYIYNI